MVAGCGRKRREVVPFLRHQQRRAHVWSTASTPARCAALAVDVRARGSDPWCCVLVSSDRTDRAGGNFPVHRLLGVHPHEMQPNAMPYSGTHSGASESVLGAVFASFLVSVRREEE